MLAIQCPEKVYNRVSMGNGENKVRVIDKGAKSNKRPSFGGTYDASVIDEIILAAHKHGVDPKLALAIGLQESNFGERTSYQSVFHSHYSPEMIFQTVDGSKGWHKKNWSNYTKMEDAYWGGRTSDSSDDKNTAFVRAAAAKMMEEEYSAAKRRQHAKMVEMHLDTETKAGVRWIKHQMSLAPKGSSLAMQIQAFNGFGYGDENQYGVPGRVQMSKNPLYGKRIIDLMKNAINNSPEILRRIGPAPKRKK